jgi:hypothetical protein
MKNYEYMLHLGCHDWMGNFTFVRTRPNMTECLNLKVGIIDEFDRREFSQPYIFAGWMLNGKLWTSATHWMPWLRGPKAPSAISQRGDRGWFWAERTSKHLQIVGWLVNGNLWTPVTPWMTRPSGYFFSLYFLLYYIRPMIFTFKRLQSNDTIHSSRPQSHELFQWFLYKGLGHAFRHCYFNWKKECDKKK